MADEISKIVKDDPKDRIQIEVGDTKQTDFYPQVKLMRWDNEVNLSVRLKDDDVKDPLITKEGETLKWQKDKTEAVFYELPQNSELSEGGYEFEVVLKEKPNSNVIEFTIETKGLNFSYQGELTDQDLENGATRPDNVVGSYAVYHKTKGGLNNSDGMDYRTGKAFHIYRPKIEDADGNWAWGELNIDADKGTLTVTIPQDFLDNAIYPIRHAAGLTFGYQSDGASYQVIFSANTTYNRVGYSNYSPALNGTVDTILAYISNSYSSDPTTMDTFVGINEKDSVTTDSHGETVGYTEDDVLYPGYENADWHTFTIPGSPSISSSEDYILNITPTAYGGSFLACRVHYDDNIDHYNYFEDHSPTPTVESPWTNTPTTDGRYYSLYVNYTESEPESKGSSAKANIVAEEQQSNSSKANILKTVSRPLIYGYGYRSSVAVQNGQVYGSANLINFPVMISGTYDGTAGEPDLRTTANGGNIENTGAGGAGGALTVPEDLVFSPNTDGSSPYNFEIVEYDATTGKIVAFVQIPSLDYNNDTVFYMVYGDSGVTTSQEDVAGTWSQNYVAVWHLNGSYDGTPDEVKDSLGNFHGTATTAPEQTADGKVGKAQDFDTGNSEVIEVGGETSDLRLLATKYTWQFWFKPETLTGIEPVFQMDDAANFSGGYKIYSNNGVAWWTHCQGSGDNFNTGNTWSTGSFFHAAFVYDQTNRIYYKNGSYVNQKGTTDDLLSDNDDPFEIGGHTTYGWHIDGILDELRISADARTADWIKTDHATQNDPSTFYSIGSEEGSGDLGSYPSKADILVADNTQNNSAKADILTVTENSQDNKTKAELIGWDQTSDIWEVEIAVGEAQDSSAKANILVVDNVSDNESKANILVETTQDNSAKASVVITSTSDSESKANLLAEQTEDNKAKSSLLRVESYVEESLANILASTDKGNSSKASIVKLGSIPEYSKANILRVDETQDSESLANILVSNDYELYSKANIVATQTEGSKTKSDILVEQTSTNKSKSSIVKTESSDSETLGNILASQEKSQSARSSIVRAGSQFAYTKANILRTNEYQQSAAKSSIVRTETSDNSALSNLVATESYDSSSLSNFLVIQQKANRTRGNIIKAGSEYNYTTGNILRIDETQGNSAKASIVIEEVYSNSAKADIIRFNEVYDNEGKSNILVLDNTSDSRAKSNILAITSQDQSVTSDIIVETSKANNARANVLVGGQSPFYAKANVLRTDETQPSTAKASIVVTESYDNKALSLITLLDRISSVYAKANVAKTESQPNFVKADLVGLAVNFARARITVGGWDIYKPRTFPYSRKKNIYEHRV